ncbi:hypothetical protein O6H91_23G062500 [Diphasiastrum complanatum]|uniref:Uncharacterized protein n=1 Tax=Diphasiastrum complanatum TaxID=34168 RepID=A0ACC2ABD1_DIPCM|nr:hypothetical protein O6H91_23G062500 [Diphasiastrum complanatum]
MDFVIEESQLACMFLADLPPFFELLIVSLEGHYADENENKLNLQIAMRRVLESDLRRTKVRPQPGQEHALFMKGIPAKHKNETKPANKKKGNFKGKERRCFMCHNTEHMFKNYPIKAQVKGLKIMETANVAEEETKQAGESALMMIDEWSLMARRDSPIRRKRDSGDHTTINNDSDEEKAQLETK